MYYARNGDEITLEQWAMSRETEHRVALTDVGPYVVSTVWLGLDHSFGGGRPVIFETMVFAADDWEGESAGLSEFDMLRYCTLEEAQQGHEEMVTVVRATVPEIPDSPQSS